MFQGSAGVGCERVCQTASGLPDAHRGGEDDGRRLPRRPPHADDDAREHSGERRRENHRENRPPLARAEAHRGLLVGQRHGLDRLFRGANHRRKHENGERERARENALRLRDLHRVDEEREPEEPEDDARHARERADAGAEHAHEMALPRVLGEIDRRDDPERDGEEHRAEDEVDRPEHLRPYARRRNGNRTTRRRETASTT